MDKYMELENKTSEMRVFYYLKGGVEEYFTEKRDRFFLRYLEKTRISKISDIKYGDIVRFTNLKGIGEKRKNEIILRVEEIHRKHINKREIMRLAKEIDNLNDKINDEDLNDLKEEQNKLILKDKNMIIYTKIHLIKKEIEQIENMGLEIEGIISEKEIEIDYLNILESNNKEKIDTKLKQIAKLERKINDTEDTEENVKFIKNKENIELNIRNRHKVKLNKRDLGILKMAYVEGMKSVEISKYFGVSKQTISQVKIKGTLDINNILAQIGLIEIINDIAKGKHLVNTEDIYKSLKICYDLDEIVLGMLKNNKIDFLEYIPEIDYIYVNYENSTKYMGENLRKEIKDTGGIIAQEEAEKIIVRTLGENIRDIIDNIDNIDNILLEYGYRKFGKYYSKHKPSEYEALSIIFKNHIKEAIKIDSEGVELIYNIIIDELGIEIDKSIGKISKIINRIPSIMLIGNSKVVSLSSIKHEENLKKMLKLHIENYLDNVCRVITVESIYNDLKEKLNFIYKINNKQHLYSIIKYYFTGDYNIRGKSSNYFITKNETTDIVTPGDIIQAHLERNFGRVGLIRLSEELGWKNYRIQNEMVNSKTLVYTDNKCIQEIAFRN